MQNKEGNNNQQKIVTDFRNKLNKGKLFQINIQNKLNNINNNNIINNANINNNSSSGKENKEEQDINYIIKNEEENKENKLSKNLLNNKKDKRNSYHGKIYFFIAILMLLYQYCSYILLIELPIIQSKLYN
jgi:hypothetical protein